MTRIQPLEPWPSPELIAVELEGRDAQRVLYLSGSGWWAEAGGGYVDVFSVKPDEPEGEKSGTA